MKIAKFILLYIISFFVFILFLIVISSGDLLNIFRYFNLYFIIFNLIFSSLSIYFYKEIPRVLLVIVSIIAILTTFIIDDIIYPNILNNDVELTTYSNINETKNKIKIDKDNSIVINDYLGKAKYYLSIKDYSSSWIYADLYIEKNGFNIEADNIIKESRDGLDNLTQTSRNEKYIDTLLYKNLVAQNKILEAYYFCLENRNNIYDYDFLLKFKNSYLELLKSYYSIDIVESMMKLPGYSDIRFYVYERGFKLFSVEKLIEHKGFYFLYNTSYKDYNYPYIVVEPSGKLLTSGFRENKREVIIRNNNFKIPVKIEDLVVFSKEQYPVVKKSLMSNLKLYMYKNIRYLPDQKVYKFILNSIINYLTIFMIFFIPSFYTDNKGFVDYLFNTTVNLIVISWFINKIGLILMNYSLGLSITFLFLSYCLWLYIIIKKIRLLPSQF